MTAVILPFPIVRRLGEVSKVARSIAAMDTLEREYFLTSQVKRIGNELLKQGIQRNLVARETDAFSTAVRVALWRTVILRERS